MTHAPAPDRPAPASELAEVLIALRAVMADERRAVARLDLEALETISARKQEVALELARLQAAGRPPSADEARAIGLARAELAASRSLLSTAVAAVGAVLGVEADGRYDRRARCHARTTPFRVVAY